jgi:DNA-binding IclR family transcriptional regulator
VTSVEQRLTAYTSRTLTTPDQLHRALQAIRLTRTAVARGELFSGDWAVAVPVFGAGGAVIAALELQMGDLRADIAVLRPTLAVAALGLSRELSLTGCRTGRGHLRLVSGPNTAGGFPAGVVPAHATAVP